MTKPKFDYDDIVLIEDESNSESRSGQKAWVVGVFPDRTKLKFDWLPPGIVYTVEFEDGTAIDIHEGNLKPYKT